MSAVSASAATGGTAASAAAAAAGCCWISLEYCMTERSPIPGPLLRCPSLRRAAFSCSSFPTQAAVSAALSVHALMPPCSQKL